MSKWQYLTALVPIAMTEESDKANAVLNSIGDEGWEMVGYNLVPVKASALSTSPPQPTLMSVFKRRIAADDDLAGSPVKLTPATRLPEGMEIAGKFSPGDVVVIRLKCPLGDSMQYIADRLKETFPDNQFVILPPEAAMISQGPLSDHATHFGISPAIGATDSFING